MLIRSTKLLNKKKLMLFLTSRKNSRKSSILCKVEIYV